MKADSIIDSVKAVTKKWTKQRKAEERGRARSRREVMVPTRRTTIREVAWEVMEDAYMAASSNGTLPASARQIMYRARGPIQKKTGRDLNDHYFTQRLLPDYIARYPRKTADWDVTYDARGHFAEPHTEIIVPIGTLDVRGYVREVYGHNAPTVTTMDFHADMMFPTLGPDHRFSAIMFIEKEGFMPLFKAVQLAQRYDIAIMSTKGMPVVACRHLADELCGRHKIPLLVLHDFDKAGFSILGTLQDVDHGYQFDEYWSDKKSRYEFTHDINVIDLGLRLEDVKAYDLESESVRYRSNPSCNLQENGATEEEVEFLYDKESFYSKGRRVELNAFTSGDFIEWIESKLVLHGIEKVIPDGDTLAKAYRRASKITVVHEQVDKIIKTIDKQADQVKIPKTLKRTIRNRLKKDPTQPWDQVVAEVAAKNCKKKGPGGSDSAS